MDDFAILFGRPYRPELAEDRFELEALAAEELEIEAYAVPLDPIVNGEPGRALRYLPKPRGRRWLYRGWIIDEDEYTSLYDAISDRGEELIVDPESFATGLYAPNHLPALGSHTAPARWTEGDDIREAYEVALELGPPPWIVKDHVKSAKEAWHRACFVPAGATLEDFESICDRLVAIRGDRFERGFVIKRFLDLAYLNGWGPEQRRLPDEHRLFFWEGRLVAHAPYYDVESTLENPSQFSFLG
jgi:hypothetical protein